MWYKCEPLSTADFSICFESTFFHMASASSLLASLHWKSLWSKRAGGYKHRSYANDSCLVPSVSVDVTTLRRWNSNCELTDTFSPFISTSRRAASDFALDDTGNIYSPLSWSIISFNILIPVDWAPSTVTEVDTTTLVTMQWIVLSWYLVRRGHKLWRNSFIYPRLAYRRS